MMDRREFVKFVALTFATAATGGIAMPEQVRAFERLFFANTPPGSGPLVAVDEVLISGLAGFSTIATFDLYRNKPGGFELDFAINAFGGIMRWCAAPTQIIIGEPQTLCWRIKEGHRSLDRSQWDQASDEWVQRTLTGHFKFIDQNAVRHTMPIRKARGTLADPVVFDEEIA